MEKFKRFDIQYFAEENMTAAADLEPGISIDFVSKITGNINELQKVLGITEMEPMAAGTSIKVYKMEQVNTPEQVGEGETIALTKVKRSLVKTIELVLKKYRRNTPAVIWQSISVMKSWFPAFRRKSRRISSMYC